MILKFKNISYDIKVDNNLCIILNEILFNKVKNKNYLGNPKYFTSFSSMFIYLNNINIKNKFTSKESVSLEEIKNEIKSSKEEIIGLVNEFSMDKLIKETIDSINGNKEKMREKVKMKKKENKEEN